MTPARSCATCAHMLTQPGKMACGKKLWGKYFKLVQRRTIKSYLQVAQECPMYKGSKE